MWRCKNLKSLYLNKNRWKDEWEGINNYDCPTVLEICRQRAPITVYISHSKGDKKKYSVSNLKNRLKGQEEIRDVHSRSISWERNEEETARRLFSRVLEPPFFRSALPYLLGPRLVSRLSPTCRRSSTESHKWRIFRLSRS